MLCNNNIVKILSELTGFTNAEMFLVWHFGKYY